MIPIKGGYIYRAAEGKYVKRKSEDALYPEIVVKEETDDIIEVDKEED